jgi:hypothetical protein
MIVFLEGSCGGRSVISLVSVVDDTMTALACPLFDDKRSATSFLVYVGGLGIDLATESPRQLRARHAEWQRAADRASGAVLGGGQ